MGKGKILGIQNTDEWNRYLAKMDQKQQDVYFRPEYYHLFEKRGDGEAKCFVYESGDAVSMYPFLQNPIRSLGFDLDAEYYDIQGSYGYNGIVSNTADPEFIQEFYKALDQHCREANIVAEFLRINPLVKSTIEDRPDFKVIMDRENVFVDLTCDTIFETEFSRSTRKNVRKAIKNDLKFECFRGDKLDEAHLEAFIRIYCDTMDRNNADSFYYFKKGYFEAIARELASNALFMFVIYQDEIISCELVLHNSYISYSYLGGTLHDFYQYRPNDFLKYNAIMIMKEMGIQKFLLGGGPEGVLRYKKTFAENGTIPFYIGKKVHNQAVYDEIVSQWEDKYPEKKEVNKHILLKYRY